MDADRQREIAREGGRASHGGGRDDEYESRGQDRSRNDRGEFESSPRAMSQSRDDRDDERGRNGSNQSRNDRGEFEARR
jgi:Stress-induced bacterial acidophilic repeat motif